jgi:hypothetical protein
MSESLPPATEGRTRDVAVPVELVPSVMRMIEGARAGGFAPNSTIDYAGATARPRRGWFDWPTGVALFFLAAVFTFLMVVMVPRFEEMFKDFGTKLPTSTVAVLIVSRFIGGGYGWVVVWALALGIPVLVARLRPTRPGRVAWGLNIFVAVVVAGLMTFLVYALMVMPVVTLIESVSGSTSRK